MVVRSARRPAPRASAPAAARQASAPRVRPAAARARAHGPVGALRAGEDAAVAPLVVQRQHVRSARADSAQARPSFRPARSQRAAGNGGGRRLPDTARADRATTAPGLRDPPVSPTPPRPPAAARPAVARGGTRRAPACARRGRTRTATGHARWERPRGRRRICIPPPGPVANVTVRDGRGQGLADPRVRPVNAPIGTVRRVAAVLTWAGLVRMAGAPRERRAIR